MRGRSFWRRWGAKWHDVTWSCRWHTPEVWNNEKFKCVKLERHLQVFFIVSDSSGRPDELMLMNLSFRADPLRSPQTHLDSLQVEVLRGDSERRWPRSDPGEWVSCVNAGRLSEGFTVFIWGSFCWLNSRITSENTSLNRHRPNQQPAHCCQNPLRDEWQNFTWRRNKET